METGVIDRTKWLGGSDAAVVLGISPWRTPLQLWNDKILPAMPENNDPARQRVLNRGKRMEPYVLDLLAEETGLVITKRNQRYIDPEFAFLAAEIDAEAESGENIEIKTVSPFKMKEWGELDSDEIPVHYTAQVQHGMMVTGKALTVFGVLIGGDDFRTYRVERDDEVIAAIREREVAFWRNHVEALVPPPPSDRADVLLLHPRDAGTSIEADADLYRAYMELKALNADAKEIEEKAEKCKGMIQKAMGAAASLMQGARCLATWKSQGARRFNQKVFAAAHPALFDQYVQDTESRVFRLK